MYKQRLENIEQLVNQSKWARFKAYPSRLLWAFLHRKLVYPFSKKGALKSTQTFFDASMSVELPAGTDLFVFGAKTHISEIQLTKFLMKNVAKGGIFWDVGAHVGFYSLWAAHLGASVKSFEPTKRTFELLKKNTTKQSNIKIFNKAVSSEDGEVTFYEYDAQLSENNTTLLQEGIEGQAHKVTVSAVSLDSFFKKNKAPDIVKIDVEGGELQVVKGMPLLMQSSKTTFVIEYIPAEKEKYEEAFSILVENGFQQFLINNQGNLEQINDLPENMDSTNIVFRK